MLYGNEYVGECDGTPMTESDCTVSGGTWEAEDPPSIGIENYFNPPLNHSGTPTAAGLKCGYNLLIGGGIEGENNGVHWSVPDDLDDENSIKVVVLLTDGSPNASNLTSSSEGESKEAIDAGIMEWRDNLFSNDVQVYTAALTDSLSLRGRMKHYSSDTCLNGPSERTAFQSVNDCTTTDGIEYAYYATTPEELHAMYESIIASILGINFAYVTDISDLSTFSSPGSLENNFQGTGTDYYGSGGVVLEGSNVPLPIPIGFVCDENDATYVDLAVNFNGIGSLNISDVRLNYCPAE
jgi:hypothetical protein